MHDFTAAAAALTTRTRVALAARIRHLVEKTCQDDADLIKHKGSIKEGCKHHPEGLNVQRSAARQEETVGRMCQQFGSFVRILVEGTSVSEGLLLRGGAGDVFFWTVAASTLALIEHLFTVSHSAFLIWTIGNVGIDLSPRM